MIYILALTFFIGICSIIIMCMPEDKHHKDFENKNQRHLLLPYEEHARAKEWLRFWGIIK
jgi:hypothetical protein